MLQIRIKQSRSETPTLVREIASCTGIGPLAASVLVRRGIDDERKATAFLQADTFHDPFLLEGMQQAVDVIGKAARDQQSITVYGDYDCDGTCACAILYTAFKKAGIPVNVYIPDRMEEGYGLNENAIKTIARNGGLLITVDCGITNIREVELAKKLGLTVIVTDHHQPLDITPDCIAINPTQSRNYPCAYLSGAGIALKLVHALWGESAMRPLLDIAAIATVADLVPLLDENRAIVKAGLDWIMRNQRPGLMSLIRTCGLGNKKLTAGQVAFGIGPRVNAAGRMGHAKRAFMLFTTENPAEAEELALELDRENQLRQRQEQQILKSACELLNPEIYSKRTAVVALEGWHSGVIGIVASRLVDIYDRPSAVISIGGDGICTGSARGIAGVDIFGALCECSAYFTRYGGHKQAGGFSLPVENLPGFFKAFEEHFQTKYPPECWIKSVECDLSLQPGDITLNLAEDLEKLAPFGVGNPAPTLLLAQAKLMGKSNLGRTDDHLRIAMEKEGTSTEGLLFRAKQYDLPGILSVCDFVGTLEKDDFGGMDRARYLVRAIRLNRTGIGRLSQQAVGTFGYGFAKCCTSLNAEVTFDEADRYMRGNPYGLRLNVHTPQTLDDAMSRWPNDEALSLVEPYLGSVRNAVHGRNALVIAPAGEEQRRYPRIFRLDSNERVREYAEKVFLQWDEMASVYKQLLKTARRPLEIDERCRRIANASGVSVDSVGAAIAVFEDLGFLTVEPMVLNIHTINEKKELSSSKIYVKLMQMAGRGGNDAKKRCIRA